MLFTWVHSTSTWHVGVNHQWPCASPPSTHPVCAKNNAQVSSSRKWGVHTHLQGWVVETWLIWASGLPQCHVFLRGWIPSIQMTISLYKNIWLSALTPKLGMRLGVYGHDSGGIENPRRGLTGTLSKKWRTRQMSSAEGSETLAVCQWFLAGFLESGVLR